MSANPFVPPQQQRIEAFTIPRIVELASRGVLRLPDVARPFVWGAEQILELFDSIYRGIPIGSLVLQEHPAPAQTVRFGSVVVDAAATEQAYAVLDGHQRIAALVAALLPGSSGGDELFDVGLSLPERRFVHAEEGHLPLAAVPVREAFSTSGLLAWTRRHEDDLDTDIDTFHAIDRLARAVREYSVPAYVLSEHDPPQTYDVFTRTNTAGVPLSRTQMFHAAFGGHDGGAGVVRALAPLGFGSLDENTVLDSLLAVRGGDIRRDIGDEFAPHEDRAAWLDETRAALERAITFLVAHGVPHVLLMPTTSVVPVLAAFLHLHPEPSPWNRRLLARWLWRTWTRFAFGRSDRMFEYESVFPHEAVLRVLPRKLGHSEAPTEYEAVESLLGSAGSPSGREFAAPTIYVRALGRRPPGDRIGRFALLALVAGRPLGPDGVPVDVAEMVERNGLAAARPLVGSSVVHAAGPREPGVAARAFWPPDAGPLAEVGTPLILASHLLDERAAHALRTSDVSTFTTERDGLLTAAMEDLLANRIEFGASTRPPIADLVEPSEPA